MERQVERRSRTGDAAENELEITLQAAATGEARSGGMEGTEARPARTETESQAAGGPSMEAIVERDNLRRALAHVKRNREPPVSMV